MGTYPIVAAGFLAGGSVAQGLVVALASKSALPFTEAEPRGGEGEADGCFALSIVVLEAVVELVEPPLLVPDSALPGLPATAAGLLALVEPALVALGLLVPLVAALVAAGLLAPAAALVAPLLEALAAPSLMPLPPALLVMPLLAARSPASAALLPSATAVA